MDLLSLPDEMLASVLKYSNHESLRKLRSLNCRMDVIAKNYRLNRMVLKNLRIWYFSPHLRLDVEPKQEISEFKMERIINKRIRRPENECVTVLNKILSKVRKIDEFTIKNMFIDEETIETILKYARLFRIVALSIGFCEIRISSERLKNFANLLKISKLNLFYCKCEDPLTDETLLGLNPSIYVTLFEMDALLITARGLYGRVHENKLNLHMMMTKTSIKFNDVVEFLKKFKTIDSIIHFGIICDVPNDLGEIKRILKSELGNKEVNDVFVWYEPSYITVQKGPARFQFPLDVLQQ